MTSPLMAKRDRYRLIVSIHEVKDAADSGGVCAVLVDIVNNNLLGAANIVELPSLFILEQVPRLGPQIVSQMMTTGAIIYVEAPPDVSDPDNWPLVVRTNGEAVRLFGQLGRRRSETNLYPLALWALPGDRAQELMRTVTAFGAMGRDHGLFREALSTGAMRLTIQSSSYTLSVNCSRIGEAKAFVRAATANLGIEVDWDAS